MRYYIKYTIYMALMIGAFAGTIAGAYVWHEKQAAKQAAIDRRLAQSREEQKARREAWKASPAGRKELRRRERIRATALAQREESSALEDFKFIVEYEQEKAGRKLRKVLGTQTIGDKLMDFAESVDPPSK